MTSSFITLDLLTSICADSLGALLLQFWCHKSGYDGVSCAKGKAAKRAIFAKCAKPLVSPRALRWPAPVL